MSMSHECRGLINCVRNNNAKMFELVLDKVYKGGSISSTVYNAIIKADDLLLEDKISFLDVLNNKVKVKSTEFEHGCFVDDVLANAIKSHKIDIDGQCYNTDPYEIFKHFVTYKNVSNKIISALTKKNLIEWLQIV